MSSSSSSSSSSSPSSSSSSSSNSSNGSSSSLSSSSSSLSSSSSSLSGTSSSSSGKSVSITQHAALTNPWATDWGDYNVPYSANFQVIDVTAENDDWFNIISFDQSSVTIKAAKGKVTEEGELSFATKLNYLDAQSAPVPASVTGQIKKTVKFETKDVLGGTPFVSFLGLAQQNFSQNAANAGFDTTQQLQGSLTVGNAWANDQVEANIQSSVISALGNVPDNPSIKIESKLTGLTYLIKSGNVSFTLNGEASHVMVPSGNNSMTLKLGPSIEFEKLDVAGGEFSIKDLKFNGRFTNSLFPDDSATASGGIELGVEFKFE